MRSKTYIQQWPPLRRARPASQSFTGSVINRHTDIDGAARVQPGSAGAGNANEMTSRDSHQQHRGSESVSDSEEHINRDWAAAAASTPLPVYNRYSTLPTDEEDAASMNGAFTEAGSRRVLKRRRQQCRASPQQPQQQQQQQQQYRGSSGLQRRSTNAQQVTKPRTWSCDADWLSYSNWSRSYGGQEVGEKSCLLC